MAIVKASYTRSAGGAKASARYIENRPGKDGGKLHRTLYTKDGKAERAEVYTMIDQAEPGSYFFRIVISPDPRGEDHNRDLSLRDITERTIASLEDRLQQPLKWVATIHADHADHRHIHAIAIVPERLNVQDFQHMRSAATQEALEQLQRLELVQQRTQEQHRGQGEGLGLELGL
jgi:hypothetical protein